MINNGTLTVNPAPLTVTAANASRLYGDPNPAFTGTITGIKNGDNITATYASAATADQPGGNVSDRAHAGGSDGKLGNYTVTSNNGTLTVNAGAADRDCGQCQPRSMAIRTRPSPGPSPDCKNGDNITATYCQRGDAGQPRGNVSRSCPRWWIRPASSATTP